jgi:hypothetical protein
VESPWPRALGLRSIVVPPTDRARGGALQAYASVHKRAQACTSVHKAASATRTQRRGAHARLERNLEIFTATLATALPVRRRERGQTFRVITCTSHGSSLWEYSTGYGAARRGGWVTEHPSGRCTRRARCGLEPFVRPLPAPPYPVPRHQHISSQRSASQRIAAHRSLSGVAWSVLISSRLISSRLSSSHLVSSHLRCGQ